MLNTEIIPTRLGDDLIVHMVTGMPQRTVRFHLHRTADTIEEQVTLSNVRLEVPAATLAAYRLPQRESLSLVRNGGQVTVMLPEVTDWETILLVQQKPE